MLATVKARGNGGLGGGLFAPSVRLILGLVFLVALAAPAGAQCVMCKAALTGSLEGQRIGRQFNAAILVMFFAPYLVMGGLAFVFFRQRLKERWEGWAARRQLFRRFLPARRRPRVF